MVQVQHKHDQDASQINDHQGILKNNNDPGVFYEDVIIV
jgi:hypothetical protein